MVHCDTLVVIEIRERRGKAQAKVETTFKGGEKTTLHRTIALHQTSYQPPVIQPGRAYNESRLRHLLIRT